MSNDANQAIIMADVTGSITYWNQSAEQLFGHSASEAIGQSLELIIPEDLRERHWAGFHQAVASGVMNLDRAATNVPVKISNGSIIVFPARFIFLQGPRGEVAGFAAIYGQGDGSEQAFTEVKPG